MNVYDRITANNRSTVLILLAFPFALFIMVFLFSILFIVATDALPYANPLLTSLWIFPWVLIVALIWILVSYFKGGAMILGMAHARPVTFDDNRELYRLVENTAIMAGLPMPKVYLIADQSLNAFATGRNPKEASIALTDGIVKKLDKAELQTVIAHELAHIGNRDTRLMIITIAGIGCFLFFGELMLRTAFRSGSGSRNAKGALIFFAIGVFCLIFGYIVAPILRFALSRRREYQADATAVKITRDPDALARALAKISGDPRVEALDTNRLVGNMCIANPGKVGFISKLYLTHPPIDKRIETLRSMAKV